MYSLVEKVEKKLSISKNQIEKTLQLLEEGATVPFIARYRKSATGNLNEEQILQIQMLYQYETNLLKRKEDVMRLIETQGKLTKEIKADILACEKLSQVEDIYRPYQQKKKTRAKDAIENGLQPFADWLLSSPKLPTVEEKAKEFINDKADTIEKVIQGGKDIIAEIISDDAKIRWKLLESIHKFGALETTLKKNAVDENEVYRMYYDRQERISTLASHRIMAIDRGEKEKILNIKLIYDDAYVLEGIRRKYAKNTSSVAYETILKAIEDGYQRLLLPSVTREIRNQLSEKAAEQSIEVFSLNLEKLLLQPPLHKKMLLGLDPAFKTGCKLAVIDPQGNLLKVEVIYPNAPVMDTENATKKLVELIQTYHIELIVIGNGTASRESEMFVASVISKYNLDVSYTIVSEAGASVYSASKLAQDEFPKLKVEERSAVSIARRVIDPLSELIKIDPKSIGVGQYQHDLPQAALTQRLDFVVLKCVNLVGVDLNSASKELLTHVSGLNKTIAQEIVNYRQDNGKFTNLKQLLKVKKLGAKTFEQCAGFLRIVDGEEPLDKTNIHPENYAIAKMIMDKCNIKTLGEKVSLAYDESLGIDPYTFQDMIDDISRPLRDYREKYDAPILRKDILDIKDLKIGEELSGTVRNVVDFGAFIDIGLHHDALAHISKMTKEKNRKPSEITSVGDIVKVKVIDIDLKSERVQLAFI